MIRIIAPEEPFGMHLKLGKNGQPITAPIAPGIVETVYVENVKVMAPGEEVDIIFKPSVVALDGEREVENQKGSEGDLRFWASGPLVVDVERTMAFAMKRKIFAPEFSSSSETSRNEKYGLKNNEPN